jgi:hypothetical protein
VTLDPILETDLAASAGVVEDLAGVVAEGPVELIDEVLTDSIVSDLLEDILGIDLGDIVFLIEDLIGIVL